MTEEVLRTTTWEPIAESHRMELVRSADEPPAELVTAVFALVTDRSGRVLLVHVDESERGWDVPGGHLDAGETPAAAAARSLAEEAGLRVVEDQLSVVGWTRTRFDGPCPVGWTYPYPDSYMVFYGAQLDADGAETAPPAGAEATKARWLTPAEVDELVDHPEWLLLLRGAA